MAARPHCRTCTCQTRPTAQQDHVMPPDGTMACRFCRGSMWVTLPDPDEPFGEPIRRRCDRCDRGYVPRPVDSPIVGPLPEGAPMPDDLRQLAAKHRRQNPTSEVTQ